MRLVDMDSFDPIKAEVPDGMDTKSFIAGVSLVLEEMDRRARTTGAVRVVRCDELPTVDAEPVRRGHWKEVSDGWDGVYYECSECGLSWTLNDGTPEENEMCYCPKCGARMDMERQEDDAID